MNIINDKNIIIIALIEKCKLPRWNTRKFSKWWWYFKVHNYC